jgi:hypothetical protein
MMSSTLARDISRCLIFLGICLCAPTCLGAGPGRDVEYSLEQIRAANIEARSRLESLCVEYETDDTYSEPPRKLRVELTVRGTSRRVALAHFTRDYPPEVDLLANDSYFEGRSGLFVQFYPNRLYCTTFHQMPAQSSWKIRSGFFLQCTGWWPPGDSEPDDPRLGTYLHKVLADPRSRLLPRQEEIDGSLCHVVERPGVDKWWLDSKIGFAPRRHESNMGDGDVVLPVHYQLSDYREVAAKIWIPWRLGRVFFEPRQRTAHGEPEREKEYFATVSRVEVNRVPADRLVFNPPPGVLVKDLETDEVTRFPGGLSFLDTVAELENKRAAIFRRLSGLPGPGTPDARFNYLLPVSIVVLSIVSLALALRFASGRRRWATLNSHGPK